jgi:hypothetical protein
MKDFESLKVLLFDSPLYSSQLLRDEKSLAKIYYLNPSSTVISGARGNTYVSEVKIDHFCIQCEKESTFTCQKIPVNQSIWPSLVSNTRSDSVVAKCGRSDSHIIRYFILKTEMMIHKIGQFPSMADIANDENKVKYKSVLKGENWSELYKAIGLAAHGEGIGSFVYLRRVFERLIQRKFDQHKTEKSFADRDFVKLSMADKVDFLSDHLPKFLVENKRIYSIFSSGIHELQNDKCLAFFDAGKRAIIMILEDELREKEDQENRDQLAKAIAGFDSKA